MQLKIIFLLVIAVFLSGCVQEGVSVVRINQTGGQQNAPQAPAQPSTEANQTAINQTEQTETAAAGITTRADLAVSSFLVSTIYPQPREEFEISFKIKNAGTESIKNFEYSILVMKGDDIIKSEQNTYVPELLPGSTSSKITKAYSLEAGSYEIVLTLDSANAFKESNEENNVKKQSIVVMTPSSSNSSAGLVSSSGSSISSSSENETDRNSSGGCSDSDGGLNYEQKGICTDSYGSNIADSCIDINELWEWYCLNNRCEHKSRTCYCPETGQCE